MGPGPDTANSGVPSVPKLVLACCWGGGRCPADPRADAGLPWVGWVHRLGGCYCSGAGACPLVGRAGTRRLRLQGPGGPGSNACVLVCGTRSWALWWARPSLGLAVG